MMVWICTSVAVTMHGGGDIYISGSDDAWR